MRSEAARERARPEDGRTSAAVPAVLGLDVAVERPGFELRVVAEIDARGVTAVLGPSGSGKTTLLRAIAGLEPRATGRIAFAGEVWQDDVAGLRVAAHRRPIGTMFQEPRLFEHLDVDGNLAFADRRSRRARGASPIDRAEVVDALDLTPLLGRRVGGLSGGEKQRAALGRTLLRRPRLLLLDEPLAALDVPRKRELLAYLQSVPGRFRLPTLFVSHAIDEVALLADRVLVLAGGKLRARGPTAEVLEELDLGGLATPSELASVVGARVVRHDPEVRLTWLEVAGQPMSVPGLEHLRAGESIRLVVRARDVSLALRRPEGVSIRNLLDGTIVSVDVDGDSAFARVTVDLGGARLQARITRASSVELGLASGLPIVAMIKSVSLEGGARLEGEG